MINSCPDDAHLLKSILRGHQTLPCSKYPQFYNVPVCMSEWVLASQDCGSSSPCRTSSVASSGGAWRPRWRGGIGTWALLASHSARCSRHSSRWNTLTLTHFQGSNPAKNLIKSLTWIQIVQGTFFLLGIGHFPRGGGVDPNPNTLRGTFLPKGLGCSVCLLMTTVYWHIHQDFLEFFSPITFFLVYINLSKKIFGKLLTKKKLRHRQLPSK